jgi:hypothetical protein
MANCDERAPGAPQDVPNNDDEAAIIAELCGKDLGEYDKKRGIFDPKPPCGIGGAFAVIYKRAYLQANPKS